MYPQLIFDPQGRGFDGIKMDIIADGQYIPRHQNKDSESRGFRILVEQVHDDIT